MDPARALRVRLTALEIERARTLAALDSVNRAIADVQQQLIGRRHHTTLYLVKRPGKEHLS